MRTAARRSERSSSHRSDSLHTSRELDGGEAADDAAAAAEDATAQLHRLLAAVKPGKSVSFDDELDDRRPSVGGSPQVTPTWEVKSKASTTSPTTHRIQQPAKSALAAPATAAASPPGYTPAPLAQVLMPPEVRPAWARTIACHGSGGFEPGGFRSATGVKGSPFERGGAPCRET
jgi:hypothetical protein